MKQAELFDDLLEAYAGCGASMSNQVLYKELARRGSVEAQDLERTVPIGRSAEQHSPVKRRIRWHQQTLRALGLLERDEGAGRGHWRLTPMGRRKLTPALPGKVLVGFSTDLGVALWAAAGDVFSKLDEPIVLCLSSLPYPLARPRAYGNPTVETYVDWACKLLEPVAKHLVPGGTIALNISNEIFVKGSPARSLYVEHLVIALCQRLGLHLWERMVWENPSKPPGPLQWASLTRQQLNAKYEPIYCFTNDPMLLRSDNRRVLETHTKRQLALMKAGGEQRTTSYGDGAHRLRPGSYGRVTPGRIPGNVLTIAHRCADKEAARREAIAQGLPTHGAAMPLKLAQFLIEFLTEPGDLVVDPCGGWMTTGKAAEVTGRPWLCTELMGEYVLGAANRFRQAQGFACFGQVQGLIEA